MRDRTPSGLTLVLDENLAGHRVINGLRQHGIPVMPQTDLMARGIPDEDVLKALAGCPDYCLLTKDSDFHRHQAIRQALLQHGVGAFVITAHKNRTAAELVALVASAWPAIQRYVAGHPRPFVAT